MTFREWCWRPPLNKLSRTWWGWIWWWKQAAIWHKPGVCLGAVLLCRKVTALEIKCSHLKTQIVLLVPCSGSPLPRAGIYWHFLLQFICANIRTIAAERLPRLYILISDRSNRSWPSLKWTIMELKLKWGWGAYCGLELEFLFHLDFFSSVSYSELWKIKTDTISNLVWTEPPGKRGVVLTLKSD